MCAAQSLIGFSDLEHEVNDKINDALAQAMKVAEQFAMLKSDFVLFKHESGKAHEVALENMRVEHKTALNQQLCFIEQFTRENKDLIARNEEMVRNFDIQIDQKVCEVL